VIISASRREDIPARRMEWFLERLKEGHADVVNPMNPRQVSRVSLRPADVDGVVFWTKDMRPLLSALPRLSGLPFYVQATLTPYGPDIEPGAPNKTQYPDALLRLADAQGPEAVVWRYDPILLDPNWTADAHLDAFARLSERLSGAVNLCVISFLDVYAGVAKALAARSIRPPEADEARRLAAGFSAIAREHGQALATCAEAADLSEHGIAHAKCVDASRIGRVAGHPVRAARAKGQRAACGCDESRDIGEYGQCGMACVYCYGARMAKPG